MTTGDSESFVVEADINVRAGVIRCILDIKAGLLELLLFVGIAAAVAVVVGVHTGQMNVSSSDGILRFEFDEDLLHTIEDALGSMKNESRRVLKNAVNETASLSLPSLFRRPALFAGRRVSASPSCGRRHVFRP